jgi:hypothetical protein
MIIPCIKDKCLKYPACRNKNYIQCTELCIYYWKMRETHSIEYTWKELFKQLGGVTTINIYDGGWRHSRPSHNPEEY